MIRETQRLWLEPYAPSHAEGLFALNSDPKVTRYLSGPQTLDQIRERIVTEQDRWARLNYGWWALIAKESGAVVGAACVQNTEGKVENPLEVGWRLVPAAHGKGLATEAGQAALDYAFDVLHAPQIIAVAHPDNLASQRVMQRLGMVDVGMRKHYGQMCVTYEMKRPA